VLGVSAVVFLLVAPLGLIAAQVAFVYHLG